jgi:non-ribosomal peptide synthetase component F
MTLLAAFKTLLYRYSGEEEIVVGSPVATRNMRETESLIGFFVNILALRTDLSGNPTFEELLARVRRTSLGAYAHQDVPFESLLGELHIERKTSHAPLFQVVFVLQNIPLSALELPGLTLSPFNVDRGTTHLDLYLSVTDTEQGMNWLLKYNTDLFDDDTIAQLLDHYEALLHEIVARPERRLLDIPLSTGAVDGAARSKPESQNTFRTARFTF